MKTHRLLFATLLACACSAKADRASAEPEVAPATAEPAPADAGGIAGTYALSSEDFAATPEGCRSTDAPMEDWTLAMGAPQDGSWSATESYGEHSSQYTCEGSAQSFACEMGAGHDYTTHGVDADVKLDVQYDGAMNDAGRLEGSFSLAFTCEGSQCAEVASQWGVNSFPCENAGTFEGEHGA